MKTSRQLITRWAEGGRRQSRDELAVEEPLEIRIDTQPFIVTMRTPGNDEELAAGFLFSEGLIRARHQVRDIRLNKRNRAGNSIDVFLAPEVSIQFQRLARRSYVSSSCGLCGAESIKAVRRKFKPVKTSMSVDLNTLLGLPDKLRATQPAFERTGGLHAAGIFTAEGELIVAREDIGRHNAVDKVIGYGFLNSLLPFDRHLLVVSGRASFEIIQKSIAARVPVLCAVSAPSSLAVAFARANKQTLVGFLRGDRLNVYSGASRVDFSRE